jgi:hypothetical protein
MPVLLPKKYWFTPETPLLSKRYLFMPKIPTSGNKNYKIEF